MSEPAPPRDRCYRCLRPAAHCLCATLPHVPTRTRLVVLQHPHERTHPFGTAKLLRLCVPGCEVHVPCPGFSGTLEHTFALPEDAVVLFPTPDAPRLDELVRDGAPSTLVAIDGTWGHARGLWRDNRWLHRYRRARLLPSEPSRYRIRKEPRADYVSTLEAVVQALRVLEPDNARLDELITAFDRMIDRQIGHAEHVQRFGRFKTPRNRPSRALSPHLFDPRLVVTYAESALPGGDEQAERGLVQWVAARIDGDEVFEALLRPDDVPPSPHHLAHMGITPDELANGEPLVQAAARFARWLPADAPLATWTPTTLEWSSPMLPPDAVRVHLKSNYCNFRNRRAGVLEQVLAHESLHAVPLPVRGRARVRLGNALAVARWLRASGSPPAGPVAARSTPCS